eukprot:15430139-Alexandrium_andersonii.AAC.1
MTGEGRKQARAERGHARPYAQEVIDKLFELRTRGRAHQARRWLRLGDGHGRSPAQRHGQGG